MQRVPLICTVWLLAVAIASFLPAQGRLTEVIRADTSGDAGYYWNNGKQVPIRSLVDWRAIPGHGASVGTRSLSETNNFAGGDFVEVTPDLILIRSGRTDGFSRGLQGLSRQDSSREVFALATNNAILIDSGQIVVQLDSTWDLGRAEMAVAGRGLRIVKHLFEGWYVLKPRAEVRGMQLVEIANHLVEDGFALSSEPDFFYPLTHRQISCRGCKEDPYYGRQWHLEHDGGGGVSPVADIDAEDAWAITRGHRDIAIAIIDNGVEIRHEDFQGPGKIRGAWDFGDDDPDPTPRMRGYRAHHGTACAGVATAVGGNGRGVSGMAPDVTLIPIRFLFNLQSSIGAQVIRYAVDAGADVISNSWGPFEGSPMELPEVVQHAFAYATSQGRGGKGTLIFWAAGNGNESMSDDGFASSEYVLAIGATNDQARRSIYSDYGPELDFVAPSSGEISNGAVRPGIWTTDLSRDAGISQTDYTGNFGGTSSSAPLAAGVAALVLSVAPDLTWRQVYDVLKETADKVDPEGGRYQNGFSEFYGWGKINAGRAVRRAFELASLRLVVQVTDSAGGSLEGASFGVLKHGASLEGDLVMDDLLVLGLTDTKGLFDTGQKVGGVPAGLYQIKVVHPDYQPFKGEVDVRPGSQPGIAVLTFKLAK